MNRKLKLSRAQLEAKEAARTERRARALAVLREWHPTPVPPLACGPSIRELASLERDGLTQRVGVDALGDSRFALTPRGLEAQL